MTSKERATLKSIANKKKTTIQIGSNEMHENLFITIGENFNNSEIVKIKVNRNDKTDKEITFRMSKEIESKVKCEIVSIIGTTIILYKKNKNPELNLLND